MGLGRRLELAFLARSAAAAAAEAGRGHGHPLRIPALSPIAELTPADTKHSGMGRCTLQQQQLCNVIAIATFAVISHLC